MSGNQGTGILDPVAALEKGFEKVAELTTEIGCHPQGRQFVPGQVDKPEPVHQYREKGSAEKTGDKTLNSLIGTDPGRKFALSPK